MSPCFFISLLTSLSNFARLETSELEECSGYGGSPRMNFTVTSPGGKSGMMVSRYLSIYGYMSISII